MANAAIVIDMRNGFICLGGMLYCGDRVRRGASHPDSQVDRIGYFSAAGAQPNDFNADTKEVDVQPLAKWGRIPVLTDNPRLQRIDL